MRTQVGIVGAGPAGLTLALLLAAGGDRVAWCSRPAAASTSSSACAPGLLEQNTVDLLHGLGVGERLAREGLDHSGVYLRFQGRTHHVDMLRADRPQDHHLRPAGDRQGPDRRAARARRRAVHFEVVRRGGARPRGRAAARSRTPTTARRARSQCDVIAGCDGFHGVCRPSIPDGVLTDHELVVSLRLARDPRRGGAEHRRADLRLARARLRAALDALARRSAGSTSRFPPDERPRGVAGRAHLGGAARRRTATVNEGPIFDKGITPMRSFVCEPMQHGRLFLAGDAAHIVPPTGAKGLNLAVNDVRLLGGGAARLLRRRLHAPRWTATPRRARAASGARRTSPTT